MWASGHNCDIKRAAHGYEPTREAAWRHSPRAGAEVRESRLLARSSSPSRYFCLRECPKCPMSINLTPYRIREVAHSRHCRGKLILAAADLLGPMANLVCFGHINACEVPETVHCG